MGLLATILGVPLGVFLTVQMLAALYAPIDHWHDIGRHRWRVIRTIAVWGVVYVGLFSLMAEPWASAFVLGAAIVLGLHFVAVLGGRLPVLGVRLEERRRLKALLKEANRS